VKRFLIQNLKKYFERGGYFSKKERHLVLDINELGIEEHNSVGLIGESGSGKTTIARLLMRIIRPDSGRIKYFGKDIYSLKYDELRDYRKRCQMIFQDPSSQFNPRMTIEEILSEPLIIHKLNINKEQRIKNTLDLVSLPQDIRKRYIHQISGGQRQRISIARALILNPSFIICDEPVSALDISVMSQILNLLLQLKQDLNIHYLMISHDLLVVRFLCDYIYILYNGRIVERGTTREIFEEPAHPYTRELLNAAMFNIEDQKGLKADYYEEEASELNLCPFRRCTEYKRCIGNTLVEKKITETHSVLCSL